MQPVPPHAKLSLGPTIAQIAQGRIAHRGARFADRAVPIAAARGGRNRALRMAARLAAALAGLALAGVANPQEPPPQPLRLDGTPSVFADDAGQVSACGLRVFGVEALPPPRDAYRTVDISLLMSLETMLQGIGLVKASSQEANASAFRSGGATRPLRVSDGWLRVPGSQRTVPRDGKPLPDPADATALRYLTDAAPLFAVADAILAGTQIEVSVIREGVAAHPVYRGAVTMEPRARQQFVACMRDLQQRASGLK